MFGYEKLSYSVFTKHEVVHYMPFYAFFEDVKDILDSIIPHNYALKITVNATTEGRTKSIEEMLKKYLELTFSDWFEQKKGLASIAELEPVHALFATVFPMVLLPDVNTVELAVPSSRQVLVLKKNGEYVKPSVEKYKSENVQHDKILILNRRPKYGYGYPYRGVVEFFVDLAEQKLEENKCIASTLVALNRALVGTVYQAVKEDSSIPLRTLKIPYDIANHLVPLVVKFGCDTVKDVIHNIDKLMH